MLNFLITITTTIIIITRKFSWDKDKHKKIKLELRAFPEGKEKRLELEWKIPQNRNMAAHRKPRLPRMALSCCGGENFVLSTLRQNPVF